MERRKNGSYPMIASTLEHAGQSLHRQAEQEVKAGLLLSKMAAAGEAAGAWRSLSSDKPVTTILHLAPWNR